MILLYRRKIQKFKGQCGDFKKCLLLFFLVEIYTNVCTVYIFNKNK